MHSFLDVARTAEVSPKINAAVEDRYIGIPHRTEYVSIIIRSVSNSTC